MKNSLKSFLKKLQDTQDGFTVLKKIRGGILPPADNTGTECTNSGTSCSGENRHRCSNTQNCTGTTNTAICSNGTCVF